jgi:hypothetical protein
MTGVDTTDVSPFSQDWLMTNSFIPVRAGYLSQGISGPVWADSGNTMMLNQLF